MRVVSLRVAARLAALVVIVLLVTATVLHFYVVADKRSGKGSLEAKDLGGIKDVAARRETVKQMMTHAWESYKKYAWGQNELRPLKKQGYEGSFLKGNLGVTIVDSLDTLYIMGMTEEFNLGRDWIEENFTLKYLDSFISVFETNIRIVGGLLSCYALTGDSMFKDKAENTARYLLPAFNFETGIPCSKINPKTTLCEHPFGPRVLAGYGTLSLEFNYLSDVTGDQVYREKVSNIRRFLYQIEKPDDGLYPVFLTNDTWQMEGNHASIGALGDSFFEYLLKEWLRSGRTDGELKQIYEDAMSSVINNLLSTTPSGLVYFSDLKEGGLDSTMSHLKCFTGGLLALGSQTLEEDDDTNEYCLLLAKGIANTCHESYNLTKSKLGPETFSFTDDEMFVEVPYYILRPEVVETYFYLWRATKDPKYRQWGWEAVQALKTHCYTPNGFSGILYVNLPQSPKDDVQQSFFLSETLKYLYLLFSDDDLIPLDQWVFNTEAHPLPIKGANNLYRSYLKD